MAAALKAFWGVVRWRWTPFFGLVGGSLLYVLIAILVIPSKIDTGKASAKGEELVVVGDEPATPNALTTRPPRSTAPRTFAPGPASPAPPQPMAQPIAPAPLRPEPPPVHEVNPTPAPPPPEPTPPAPPPPPAEEEEEEEEQGAVDPRRVPARSLAGALRILPPPAGRAPAGAPEPEPEPDEPDEEE